MHAEIHELDVRVAHQLAGCERHDDLSTVSHRHQPRGTVQRGPVVVAIADLAAAGVNAHADAQRAGLLPRFGVEQELRGDRGVDGVGRSGKRGMSAVAGGLHHVTAVGFDRVAQDLVVARQGLAHRVRVFLPQTRRTFEVSEQEGDRP
jgi:hypothetical protein